MTSLAEEGFLSAETTTVVSVVEHRYAPWLAIIRMINARAVKVQYEAQIPNNYLPALMAAACYVRTLTNIQAAVLLAVRGLDRPARILLRSAMESLFQLKAIEKDRNVVNSIIAGDDVFRKRLLEKYTRLDDPTIRAALESMGPLQSDTSERFKEWGVKTLSVEQMAARAEMTPLYLSAYPLLSNTAHAGVRDLEGHFETDAKGEIIGLKNEPQVDGLEVPFVMAAEFLMLALEGFAAILKIDLDHFLDEPQRSLRALTNEHRHN